MKGWQIVLLMFLIVLLLFSVNTFSSEYYSSPSRVESFYFEHPEVKGLDWKPLMGVVDNEEKE